MAINQNTIQERLQVLHDYIQRTIDALNDLSNSTRNVVQGLGGQNVQRNDVNAGLSHSSFANNWQNNGQTFVQTPWGIQAVPYGVNPMFTQGYANFVQPNWNGLQHTSQNVIPQNMFQLVQTPYGLVQVPVANQGWNQGWNPGWVQGGLQHSSIPQVWGQVAVQPFGYGMNTGFVNPMFNTIGGLQHTTWTRENVPVTQTQPNLGNPVL